jgi:alkylation response protein AidB-like acyl-CoA dehydrogenase
MEGTLTTSDDWRTIAERIAETVVKTHAANVDETGHWPAESVAALGKSGLLGLTVSTALGGLGMGPIAFAEVTRLIACQCASTAMIYVMHVGATQTIASASDFPERESILRRIAAGQHLSTLAFSENGSRSHFWAPVSQAVANGSMHVLSAEKSWVTSAGHADSYVVSCRAVGASEPMASTLYFVPTNTAGVTPTGKWNGLGLRGNASAPMHLQNVAMPATSRVCRDGDGFNVMLSVVLPWFQIGSAAVAVGIARAAVEGTKQHLLVSKLEHLGQPLSSLMNLRARLARMQILADIHECFVREAGARIEKPDPATMLAVLECKAAATEAALEVTDLAMRTCGGASFSKHLSVERNFRDARAGSVMAPTTDVLHDFIGKAILGMPLF